MAIIELDRSLKTVLVCFPSICCSGPRQMACDEAMLLSTAQDARPRFRFYTWSDPTISLGYFQDYQQFFSVFPELSDLAVVRRLTGGGAILHDLEITYCLTLPSSFALYKEGPIAAYVLVHEAIADALKPYGISLQLRPKQAPSTQVRSEPEFCFARPCPTDLVCAEGKLVGSAQRRLPGALMQHGSLILTNRYPQQPTASLTELTKTVPAVETLEQAILDLLADRMSLEPMARNFNEDETARTDQLTAKYQGDDWTMHRQS